MEVKVYLKNGLSYNFRLSVVLDVDAESQPILFPLIVDMLKEHSIDSKEVRWIRTSSIKINNQ